MNEEQDTSLLIASIALNDFAISIESSDGNILFHKTYDKLNLNNTTLRNARNKLEREHHILKLLCEKIKEYFLTDNVPNIDKILICGDDSYIQILLESELLPVKLRKLLKKIEF